MPLPLIAIVGYGVSAAMAATIAALHKGKVLVPRVADWGDVVPSVYVHPSLSAETFEAWREAADWWRARGYEIGAVRRALAPVGNGVIEVVPISPEAIRAWTLAVAGVDMGDELEDDGVDPGEENAYRDVHEVRGTSGQINRVTVSWDEQLIRDQGCERKRVAAHELGHALGHMHCTARLGRKHTNRAPKGVVIPKHGHLMNPIYSDGGWGDQGLGVDPS